MRQTGGAGFAGRGTSDFFTELRLEEDFEPVTLAPLPTPLVPQEVCESSSYTRLSYAVRNPEHNFQLMLTFHRPNINRVIIMVCPTPS
jgi:hypothetical protein